jgi:hypothetical protein
MNIKISTTKEPIYFDISFDPFGNMYFDGSKHMDHESIYRIDISGDNKPYAEKGSYKIINKYENKIGSFKPLVKKMEENDSSDDDPSYYPENEDHIDEEYNFQTEIIDEDNIKKYGENNLEFVFSKLSNNVPDISYREDGDIMALYDVYLYDDNLIFKSISPDNSTIFRFRVYKDEIYFRPIGELEKRYTLHINSEGELLFL